MTQPEDTYGTLHIYGQGHWHDAAFIVGDPKGLLALRTAIDGALAGKQSQVEVTVTDGEGYLVHVLPASLETLEQLRLPYIDELPGVEHDTKQNPWSLLSSDGVLYKPTV